MNYDEASFLAAIQAAPNDPAIRLIYADWLEEQADPRAELVRIQEEVRNLPVYSDRYWELRPRRTKLRSRSPKTWLKTMGYKKQDQLLFAHGIPDGWEERWRLIREFMDRWAKDPLANGGGRPQQIKKIENQFHIVLPPSLREFVAFTQDLPQASPRRNFRAINMHQAGQRHTEHVVLNLPLDCLQTLYAVHRKDLVLPDPPVHFLTGCVSYPTITDMVFDRIFDHALKEPQCFRFPEFDLETLVNNLKNTFPIQAANERYLIFESKNIIVRIAPNPLAFAPVDVLVAKRAINEEMPPLLLSRRQAAGFLYDIPF